MSVIAVERALILLRYIIENEGGLSIREASRNLGYSPATVQKLINALNSQGYVVQDEHTERYHLGPEAVQLGLTALSRLEVRRVAHPHLEALSDATQETVFLAISRGSYAVYVDKVVSSQTIRMDAAIGEDRPYNCTAIGKVLLAGMPDEDIDRLAAAGVFDKHTENSIVDADELLEELGSVRQDGYALDREEYAYGASCVAVPIYNYDGETIAAVTVSGPKDRMIDEQDTIVNQLKLHAAKISAEMGYRELQTVVGGSV